MTQLPVRLPYRFLLINGIDTDKFLQGQCSVDLDTLDDHNFSYGTLNTPKGRIYALFKIIRVEDGLLLSMHEDTFDSMLNKLSKYAAFFKCELKEASYYAYGYDHQNYAQLSTISGEFEQLTREESTHNKVTNDDATLLKLPSKQGLLQLWSSEPLSNATDNSDLIDYWHAKEASDGIPEIYSSSQEQFILQELNLHKLNAVSFTKGCYTGQEIIARMKYLGKQKKQMFVLESKQTLDSFEIEPGEVHLISSSNETKKGGPIVRLHRTENGKVIILAVLNRELIDSQTQAYLSEQPDLHYSIKEIEY